MLWILQLIGLTHVNTGLKIQGDPARGRSLPTRPAWIGVFSAVKTRPVAAMVEAGCCVTVVALGLTTPASSPAPRQAANGKIGPAVHQIGTDKLTVHPLAVTAAPRRSLFRTARRVLCLAVGLAALLPSVSRALDHTQIAVVVNTWDPLSVEIGEYYAEQRRIPPQNVIRVGFPPGKTAMTAKEFGALKVWVDEQTLPGVEAYALTWAAPYRVECMSITSAFAFGFSSSYCAEGCGPTQPSPYFNVPGRQPFTQSGIRPAMVLAAASFAEAKALIDRGVKSDGLFPNGTTYLLSTSDSARNVRAVSYALVEKMLKGSRLRVRTLEQDVLTDAKDVLFYFTGKQAVEGLETLRFMPGAVADHVTSFGGAITSRGGQMSALRWLEAGASGSYGTVVEPCNLPEKFPFPPVVIGRYLRGETLIEAYWKSVLMPGQGIFIGEPLATPFRRRGAP
jgi:uncharacterized protein (TIGR03790 family)